jgi:hypothetical protein
VPYSIWATQVSFLAGHAVYDERPVRKGEIDFTFPPADETGGIGRLERRRRRARDV